LVIRAVPRAGAPDAPLYTACQQVDVIIAEIIGNIGSIVSFKQGLEETILILKGETPDALASQVQRLSGLFQRRIAAQTAYLAVIGVGHAAERLGTIARSFAQAQAQISSSGIPTLRPIRPAQGSQAQGGPQGEERPTPAGMPAPPDDRQQEQSHSAALIAKARSYIDAHYADPDISLSLAAAQVLLSPSYFSVVFAREVGETFIEYLTNVRIRRAIELLRTTSLTSSEIAYQVGYHNPRYFYSVFRKVAGLPPNEFRRRA
jgi:two-component system response regulator YesN